MTVAPLNRTRLEHGLTKHMYIDVFVSSLCMCMKCKRKKSQRFPFFKDGLPYLFHSFRNKYFNKISLGFKINCKSFEKMHGFPIYM